jgi:MFS transporter, MHS family, shikimate and dehydroshikimate transport protein
MSQMNPSEQRTRKVVLASLIGATIEWYDFFLYGVVAGIVFNKLFFPADLLKTSEFVSTSLAYATFAVGFLARPLGGLIFGHFGDRIGRKSMLVLTLLIMGVATVLIGLLPTYEQIGIAAPLLLLLFRVLQGIGLGGEWGGAVLMAYEYAPKEKRGFYASIPQIGLAIGLCLASGLVGLMSSWLTEAQFLAWGWRVGFVASILLVGVGVYIRQSITETPEFERVKAAGTEAKMPFVDLIKRYPGSILLGMGARYIDGVFFNIFAVFSIGYLANIIKVPRTEALWAVSSAAFVMIFAIPVFGWLSDRLGRPRTYAIGSFLLALCAVPLFMAFNTGHMGVVTSVLILCFGIVYAMCYGPEAALFADLFDARVRYTGISFVYQFSGIFASGITPNIAAYLFEANGKQPWYIAAYVIFAALVSMCCAMAIGRLAAPRESLPLKPLAAA